MPTRHPLAKRKRAGLGAEMSRSPWAIWLIGVPFFMVPLFLGLYLFGHNPFAPLLRALEDETALERQIVEIEAENANLQQDVDALKPGEFGIEKRAREHLGWSKPGEVVVHVPDKK